MNIIGVQISQFHDLRNYRIHRAKGEWSIVPVSLWLHCLSATPQSSLRSLPISLSASPPAPTGPVVPPPARGEGRDTFFFNFNLPAFLKLFRPLIYTCKLNGLLKCPCFKNFQKIIRREMISVMDANLFVQLLTKPCSLLFKRSRLNRSGCGNRCGSGCGQPSRRNINP